MQGTDTPLHSPKSPRGQGNNYNKKKTTLLMATKKSKYVIRHHWRGYVDIEVMASSEEEAYGIADRLYNAGENEGQEIDYINTYVENVTELYN